MKELARLLMLLAACCDCPYLIRCPLWNNSSTEPALPRPECEKFLRRLVEKLRQGYTVQDYLKLLSRVTVSDMQTVDSIVDVRYTLSKLVRECTELCDDVIRDVLSSLNIDALSDVILDPEVEDIYVTPERVIVSRSGLRVELLDIPEHECMRLCRQFLNLAHLAGCVLSVDKPSCTFSIKFDSVRLRITVDVWPVTENVVVHIRKHRKVFTLEELVKLGTVDENVATTVLHEVLSGRSLLVCGVTGVGKTTFVIAVDLALPRSIKRVYVDEFDEFPDVEDIPQVKYRSIFGRVREIERVLVRGGGLLIIGELRESEHYEAFKLALTSGFQVLTTIHADSIDMALHKLRMYCGDSFLNIVKGKLLLVELRWVASKRKVTSIRLV